MQSTGPIASLSTDHCSLTMTKSDRMTKKKTPAPKTPSEAQPPADPDPAEEKGGRDAI